MLQVKFATIDRAALTADRRESVQCETQNDRRDHDAAVSVSAYWFSCNSLKTRMPAVTGNLQVSPAIF